MVLVGADFASGDTLPFTTPGGTSFNSSPTALTVVSSTEIDYQLYDGAAPGAWTVLAGKQLRIFDAKPLPAKDPKGIGGKLGEIVAVEGDGFTVVCADGRFKVTRVQPADGKKIEAGEWAKSANVQVKARFT